MNISREKPSADQADAITAFLRSLPPGAGVCPEHDPRWLAVLREGLGHETLALVARDDDGEICGYLPLSLVKSRLFGRFVVSLPYLNRAGIVAADSDTAARLVEQAVAVAEDEDAQYLELRHHTEPVEHVALGHLRDKKARMVLDLPASGDELWSNLKAKVRNQVRKGDKHELTIRWGGEELLGDFYDIFAVNMRDLGTPVYGRSLFEAILHHLGGEAELAVVDCQGRPAAAALLTHSDLGGVQTQVPSASCLRSMNRTNANMWMYHRLLERAIERGSVAFDFGRSSEGAGTWRFKKQWGAQPSGTPWQIHLRRGELDAVRPNHPRYQRRIRVWQRLPVWLTKRIGPGIVRGIP
ncbi:MAG: FemAB family XrtA/PEP-CTERM system-associated protein [Phycisphaeraceae bacterium]